MTNYLTEKLFHAYFYFRGGDILVQEVNIVDLDKIERWYRSWWRFSPLTLMNGHGIECHIVYRWQIVEFKIREKN